MSTPPAVPVPHDEPHQPPAPRVVVASVLTAAGELPYRRAGRGAPLLLLASGGELGSVGALLLRHLAARFRVVAPDLDGDPMDAVHHLGDLMDGIGLDRACVVADQAFGPAAVVFSLLDPERVERVALVRHDDAAPAVLGALSGLDAGSPHRPLLVLSLRMPLDGGAPAPGALGTLVRFLAP